MKTTFAVFHADRNRSATGHDPKAIRGGTLTKYRNLDGYRRMIRMLNDSIRRSNPGSNCVILTDAHTGELDGLGADEIVRFDVDAQSLMLARMEAQIEFLRRHAVTDGVVLLDSDMLVVESLAPVFEGPFAVGVTHREDEKEMPYNGGIYFVRTARLAEAIRFFERMLEIYQQKYREYAAWWGDQLALRDVVLEFQSRSADDLVRVFPCSTFNYSPAYGSVYRDVLRAPGRAAIWHFKGSRKLAMRVYAQSYLAQSRMDRAGAHLALRGLYLLERVRRKRPSNAAE
jgi:hypothetical protein